MALALQAILVEDSVLKGERRCSCALAQPFSYFLIRSMPPASIGQRNGVLLCEGLRLHASGRETLNPKTPAPVSYRSIFTGSLRIS